MFDDEVISGYGAAAAKARSEQSRPQNPAISPLEAEVVLFFDQYRDRLLRYVCCLGLPMPDGEEIIQEVFLLLYQHLRRGKSRENLRGWLFSVTHNLALKRRGRIHRESAPPAGAFEIAVEPGLDPEAQAAANQRQKRLLAVVEALPEVDRLCLTLRAEGLRYREIAEVLDISLGAVSLSLSRSLTRVARAMER